MSEYMTERENMHSIYIFAHTSRIIPFLCLVATSCFQDIAAPSCILLSDCPSNAGYTACESGYCFVTGRCDDAEPMPGDGCCPVTEGDRSVDTDCLVFDQDLGGRLLTVPAGTADGMLFVTGVVTDPVKGGQVMLWQVSQVGHTTTPVVVGDGEVALPAVLNGQESVYAAHAGGVIRLSSRVVGAVDDSVASSSPVAGLCLAGKTERPFLAWPTADRQVVLYQEQARMTLTVDLATLGRFDGTIYAPLGSGLGTRLYVASSDGQLVGIELAANPVGPVAHQDLGAPLAGPPVESAGTVYLATDEGILMAVRERDQGFDTAWTLDLKGALAGRLLMDANGDVVYARRDGTVLLVKDGGAFGSVQGSGSVEIPLGGWTPLLTDRGRIVVIQEDGGAVRTLVRTETSDGTLLAGGLRFDVPVGIASDVTLLNGRLVFATASGHIVSYVLSEALATGFAKVSGDSGNRNRMRVE